MSFSFAKLFRTELFEAKLSTIVLADWSAWPTRLLTLACLRRHYFDDPGQTRL
jgi:hypothetical protein